MQLIPVVHDVRKSFLFVRLVVKSTTQNSHFSKLQYIYLPSCMTSILIQLFTLVTQLSKPVEKNLAYYGLLNLWNKHFMSLLGDAKWNFKV